MRHQQQSTSSWLTRVLLFFSVVVIVFIIYFALIYPNINFNEAITGTRPYPPTFPGATTTTQKGIIMGNCCIDDRIVYVLKEPFPEVKKYYDQVLASYCDDAWDWTTYDTYEGRSEYQYSQITSCYIKGSNHSQRIIIDIYYNDDALTLVSHTNTFISRNVP